MKKKITSKEKITKRTAKEAQIVQNDIKRFGFATIRFNKSGKLEPFPAEEMITDLSRLSLKAFSILSGEFNK